MLSEAAAEGALKQRTGARGLRSIIEDVLLDVMYEIPSRADVKKVMINGDVITSHNKPLLVTRSERATPILKMSLHNAGSSILRAIFVTMD